MGEIVKVMRDGVKEFIAFEEAVRNKNVIDLLGELSETIIGGKYVSLTREKLKSVVLNKKNDKDFVRKMVGIAKKDTYLVSIHGEDDYGDGCGGTETDYYYTHALYPGKEIRRIIFAALFIAEYLTNNDRSIIKEEDLSRITENVARLTLFKKKFTNEKVYVSEYEWNKRQKE